MYKSWNKFRDTLGVQLPAWDELPEDVRNAFVEFSRSVEPEEIKLEDAQKLVRSKMELETREVLQVQHALEYMTKFAQAGVPGHGFFMLVAKLARALGF